MPADITILQYVIDSGALQTGLDRRSVENYVSSGGATSLESAGT